MALTLTKVCLPSADFHGESTLPTIYNMSNVQQLTKTTLDEDDGLFIGYGKLPSIFPYSMQDLYDRACNEKEYIGVVLENQYLRALFIPELGGRLWSLYDKTADRELLYTNSIVRPCNLALRNAWLAGGIEFNCGMIGHHPYTCSKIFAAKTALDDGTPVLRMYEFERIRRAVYQMDFFLPDDSRMLYGRMRIVNPSSEVVPMYWWTNMAVREGKDCRNIIDADETYNNRGGVVGKNPVPVYEGIDITYPVNTPVAIDYFWKIPEDKRKYTAHIDGEGKGFIQTSTKRLQGRKLFVWGQGEGGARWQEFLTADGEDGRYVEIQAGLAHTQYECLPMPPNTAWEWLEGYGAITADAKRIHGDWNTAREETLTCLNKIVSAEAMEEMLLSTKQMAVSPATEMICTGSGWGTLENMRREKCGDKAMCPHLDFGKIQKAQEQWITLLDKNSLSGTFTADSIPDSWMLQKEWRSLIEASEPCHEKYLHLSAIYIAEQRIHEAEKAIAEALAIKTTPFALFINAQISRLKGDDKEAAELALQGHNMLPDDISLGREAFSMAIKAGLNREVISAYENAPRKLKCDGRISMYYAFALLRIGQIAEAEAVLHANGGLQVTDIREGEISLTSLFIEIEQAKAIEKHLAFDADNVQVPRRFDFRMNIPKKDPTK